MDELLFCACNSEEPLEERVAQLLEQGAQPASHVNEYEPRHLCDYSCQYLTHHKLLL
jgi:hypothetical protein